MGSPQPGESAPDFELPGVDGTTTRLSSLRGRWVLLHFTATWCPFCDSEVPHLGEIADAFASRGLRTVIVDVEEPLPRWRDYAAGHVPAAMLALHDASGAAAARFAPPRAQPSFDDRAQAVLDATLLVDPQGTIRLFLLPDSAHFDPTFAAVRREVERLVPEPVVSSVARPVEVRAGEATDLTVTVSVAQGYHVMSNRPSEPTYIPTRVAVEASGGLEGGEPRYPPSQAYSLGETSIATFAGTFDVVVPLTVAGQTSPGPHRLRGSLRYQACTASRCLFPATRDLDVVVTVLPR